MPYFLSSRVMSFHYTRFFCLKGGEIWLEKAEITICKLYIYEIKFNWIKSVSPTKVVGTHLIVEVRLNKNKSLKGN